MTDAVLPRYRMDANFSDGESPFTEEMLNGRAAVYLAADVDAARSDDRLLRGEVETLRVLVKMQETEVARLTRDRDEARVALRLLATELREEAGPPVEDTAENFPGGHDMTERRFLLQWFADRLDVLAGESAKVDK